MKKEFVRPIKMKDLWKYICSFKRKILIFFIIGVILGGTYAFVGKKAYIDPNASSQAELAAAKGTLNTTQIQNTEATADSYTKLENQRKEIQKYIDQSIYLNLDESTSTSNTLVYTISETKKTTAVIRAIDAMLVNDSFCTSINRTLKTNYSKASLYQLVRLNYDNSNDANISIDLEKSTDSKTYEISVYAANPNQINQISNIVKARVTKICNQLKNSYGLFKNQYVGSSIAAVNADQISNDKLNYVNKISTITSTMSSLMNNLGSNERTYFDALIKQEKNKATNSKKSFSKSIVVKYAILGAVIFSILMMCIVIYKYLSSDELRDASEMELAFDIPVVSTIHDINQLDLTIAEINYMIKQKNKKVAIITSNENNEDIKSVLKDLSKEFIVLSQLPKGKKDMETIEQIDSIVLLEKNHFSSLNDIYKGVNYYKNHGIEAIGAIVIDK